MLIVGGLLSSKKKKQPSQEEAAKPYTAQQSQPEDQGPVKKLKDMYKEIQREMQEESQRQQPAADSRPMSVPPRSLKAEPLPKSVEISVSPKSESRSGSRPSSKRSSRKNPTRNVRKKHSELQVESIIPKSKDDLIKGIIFSEIYGPPKSRR